MAQREPSFTKSGPGRRAIQGNPGKSKAKARGFKGVSFSLPRELSIFHPTVRAKLRAILQRQWELNHA